MAPHTARFVAEWFLAWAEERDDDLSNLKLNKLLYYAQGLHLATTGSPLFSEDIYAWSQGPVLPEVFHAFAEYGRAPIDPMREVRAGFNWDHYKDVEPTLLDVDYLYGSYSAWALREQTRRETPGWSTFLLTTGMR
ncbi:hypothetical protein C1Y63_01160 [Corynebacterium sp. 13CS0277]|uniref:Panacea domain-containing protein n=1 Tax=Corynebacterium sp. 13CS0277 TaxID=2071994 RepID=UPI000D03770D|nr:type II toxin-antitoxin system antitoxin SocA domain-containing protein [Corynebacterium sp. 13CS0277]PRQ12429.1 hypothetical protein C1Y63_01160 [Corynebacterium sp. 13CS0277]